uniref:Amino Acid/Auxin Permease (AAAP) Family putative n=1 Tax=Albugo laibachii Nc14 TaxID=890382 RepID=F0WIW5_9STRA|nr:Amino Acid/Auxin Permease (AAAP) Family putative [Albugo laibachii Nc14]|eukprot:CCA21211.1 Amino Acid/Auxin Permease (AAAP) Family putative [Albugo laibachii Nc14]
MILTWEDARVSFNLFCCVYGIGTLGMPGNFARAGPFLATAALVFMAFANTYASVACSKVLLQCPRSVGTYGDLGEWCFGKAGRCMVVSTQIANCLMIPCVFLVLGGILLDALLPNTFSSSFWSILMAITLLPVCLIPTLKEGAGTALAGCIGTIIADIIGVCVVLSGMTGHPTIPQPDLDFEQVVGTFGNLSLAYGATIVIPALQRQHSDPKRMPRVIIVTMTLISCLFLLIASAGYAVGGCQLSSNLLFAIYPDPRTGLNSLGFVPHKGAVVVAFLAMQVHITTAFGIVIHPAFYLLERTLLGMHADNRATQDLELNYMDAATPTNNAMIRSEKNSAVSYITSESEFEDQSTYRVELAEYRQPKMVVKYTVLRTGILAVLVVLAILFKKRLQEFTDLIGASTMTASCIILPIVFYLQKEWEKVTIYEKGGAVFILIVCSLLGGYVTYNSAKRLFFPVQEVLKRFPYCAPAYESVMYYITLPREA